MIMKTALGYHIGSTAKYTVYLILFRQFKTLIGFIRKFLRTRKQYKNSVRFMISTVMPLLLWHQKSLRFISKDFFVMTTMWGDSYHKGSQKSFFLVRDRASSLGYGALTYVDYILFCVKYTASCGSAFGVYYYATTNKLSPSQKDLSLLDTALVPALFTFITSIYFVGIVLAPFEMMLRGILQCYTIDCEMFVGEQRFTEDFLDEFVKSYKEVALKLVNEKTFFCFGYCCQKKARSNANHLNHGDAAADYDADDDSNKLLTPSIRREPCSKKDWETPC